VRPLAAKESATVLEEVARYFGVAERQLVGKRTGHRDERGVVLELMYRHGGMSQAEIGKLKGGLDYTAVSRERNRLRERMAGDRGLRKAVEEIEMSLLS